MQKISVKKEIENVEYFTRKRFSASATDRASGCGRRRFSHLSVSAQVNDNWAHWIQAPLTYLRSQNHNKSSHDRAIRL